MAAIDFPSPVAPGTYWVDTNGTPWLWTGSAWVPNPPSVSAAPSTVVLRGSTGFGDIDGGELRSYIGSGGANGRVVIGVGKYLENFGVWNFVGGATITINGTATVWTSGNDGAGSGLDADLLDGQQGSYYLPASNYTAADVLSKLLTVDGSGSGVDSDTVDGEHASAIVTEARIKAALATSADLQDTNELLLKQNCNIRASGGGAGTLYSTDVRDSTTGNAANVVIDPTGGFLQRSVSSRRYKTDIETSDHGLAEVLKLRSVTYRMKGAAKGAKRLGGLIAEEVHAAGLEEFVQYVDGKPEAIDYGNMVALLVRAVQDQQRTIEALERRIDKLAAARGTRG